MPDTFPLGSIPALSAWEGETLRFTVSTSLGARAKFSKRAMPSPKGKTSINPVTGEFTYEPSAEDKEEFDVWIRARNGAKEESQKITITPVTQVSSEFNFIEHVSEKPPNPDSTYYTNFAQEDAGEMRFNQIEEVGNSDTAKPRIMTKKVTVSGVKLVIEESSDDGSVWNRLKNRTNLRELTLCADEIVIRCELLVPGTDVHIYARTLRFEDTGGRKSRINTTPLAFKTNSTLDEGLDGQKGGDVYLHIQSVEAPENIIRILASGSKGQDARWGTPGTKGVDAQKWDNRVRVEGRDFDFTGWYKWQEWGQDGDEVATFVKVYEKVGSKRVFKFNWPAVNWPSSGTKPLKYPGKPGRGGDGGSVYTHLKHRLVNRVTLNAGGAGDKATSLPIPGAGMPRKAIAMEFQYEKAGMKVAKFYPIDGVETDPGEGAVAPEAKGPPAKPGEIKPLPTKLEEFPWLHPAVVRAVISYANDAYLAGHANDVERLLRTYEKALKGACDADKSELAWPLLLNELSALNLRIKSPYDYFGNPAGWVPMLSFQANHTLFKNELESSIRAMFLAYWIQYTQDRAKSAADMLKAAKDRLHAETDQALADYQAAELKVTSLEAEMASIADQIEATRKFVSGVKDTLTAQVKNDLKTEHMLRASAKILGGVMQLIPVGQPVLGSFGKALTVLGDIDIDKPADSLGGIAGAFAPVMTEVVGPKAADKAKALLSGLRQKEQLAKTEADTKAEEKKAQFDKELAKKELEKKVKDHMEKKEKAKETILNGFSAFAVSEDDIKERLEKVLADAPAYKEAVKEIESLNKRKAVFTEEMLATIQAIDIAATTIVNNQLAILDLHDQRDRKLEQLNLEALQSVQDMGRRARERLLLYQYYLLKSYHYLMLEDWPTADFRVQKLFDSFVKMIIEKPGKPSVTIEPLAESSNGMLTPTQYEALSAVFEDQLRAIAEKIIGFYQGNQGRSLSNLLVQLSPNQIETLNSDAKRVDVDMVWELDFKQDDVRITGVEVESISLAEPLPTRAANLSLEYVHDGVSKLRRDGQLYLFRSGQYRIEGQMKRKTTSDSSAPRGAVSNRTDIHWGSKVTYNPNPGDGKPKLTVTTTEPDPEEQSLVRYLIGAPTTEKSPMMSFRPGAWTSLAIKRSGADSAKIQNLVLKVNYVFQSVDDRTYTTVGIKVPDEAQPYIQCSVPDANGRTDGVGSFLRTFNRNKNRVKVTAPWRYGNRLFRGWRVGTDPHEDGPFRDDQLTLSQSVELNLQKSPYTILGAIFAPVNYEPVNDKGQAWPSCPVGWVFDDWLFINKSRAVIHIRKLSVDPWTDLRPEDPGITPEVCEPQGTNIAKLSFDKLTLLAGETARLSVCLNPEFPDTPKPQVKFVWQDSGNKSYYTAVFSGTGNTTSQAKWNNGWVSAQKEIQVDQENRAITFAP